MNSLIAIESRGTVRTTLTQNRRVMSINSGFFSSSSETVRGSKAMPQMGQLPGLSRTICGCIGHVYSIFVAAIGGARAGFGSP